MKKVFCNFFNLFFNILSRLCRNSKFIISTYKFNGSTKDGYAFFKVNCFGCHGIKARGIVHQDLHSITKNLIDKEIIKQDTGGLTPPIPSFEIDLLNISNLLKYTNSFE